MSRHLQDARNIDPQDQSIVFGEDTIIGLQAENMTPYWPTYPEGSELEREAWQMAAADAPEASPILIRGVFQAAKELEAEAYFGLQSMLLPERGSAPSNYSSAGEAINDYLLVPAGVHLDEANTWIDSLEQLDATHKAAVYRNVHDGYIGMMGAYIAASSPNTMGEAWAPER